MISEPISTYPGNVLRKDKIASLPRALSAVSSVMWLGWCVISWSWAGVIIWLLSLFWVLVAILVIVHSHVYVAEKEVAVVYNRQQRAFNRFLPAGRHWLKPGLEAVLGIISLRPSVVGGSCSAHSAEGISLEVDWKVTYQLDPFMIEPSLRSNMARTMRHKSAALLESHTQSCIQHLLETISLDDLRAKGNQRRLENKLRGLIASRLRSFGYVIHRITLDKLHLPGAVDQAIQQAYTRIVSAQADAQALAIRQQAIRSFTSEDVSRLMELEQLRMLENRVGATNVVLGQYHPMDQGGNLSLPVYWQSQLDHQKEG